MESSFQISLMQRLVLSFSTLRLQAFYVSQSPSIDKAVYSKPDFFKYDKMDGDNRS